MLETMKTRLHQAREWLLDYAYLVTLGAMIAVIAGTALYTDHLRSQQNVQAAAPAPEVSSSPTPQISPIPVPTLAPIRMPSAAVPFAPSPADRFAASPLSPYSGRVLTAGSRIPLWTWPPKQAKPAVCMRDGVVLSCVRDDLWGWSVEIRQTDESVCTYAGLSCVLVQAGGRPSHAVRRSAMCWRAFRRKASWPAYAPFACARRAMGRSRFNLARSLVFLRFAEKGTSEIHPTMVY